MLNKKGLLTIVTDNLWYGQLLLRSLAKLTKTEDFQLVSKTVKDCEGSRNIAIFPYRLISFLLLNQSFDDGY